MAMLILDKDHALERIIALSRRLTLQVPETYRLPMRPPLLQHLHGEPIAPAGHKLVAEKIAARAA